MTLRACALALFSLAMLAACTTTVPVAVIGENGWILRGTSTASPSGGSFQVSGEGMTCAGTYDAWDTSVTISMPVQCSDGRKGLVIATRDAGGVSGSGRVRLDDGTEADFVFGKAAEAF